MICCYYYRQCKPQTLFLTWNIPWFALCSPASFFPSLLEQLCGISPGGCASQRGGTSIYLLLFLEYLAQGLNRRGSSQQILNEHLLFLWKIRHWEKSVNKTDQGFCPRGVYILVEIGIEIKLWNYFVHFLLFSGGKWMYISFLMFENLTIARFGEGNVESAKCPLACQPWVLGYGLGSEETLLFWERGTSHLSA